MELIEDIKRDTPVRDERYVANLFISQYADIEHEYSYRFESTEPSNLDFADYDQLRCVINYKRINDFRFINKFFERVNEHLETGGFFFGCVETKEARKQRVLNKWPAPFNHALYTADFIYKRLLPKLPVIKRGYFAVTKGHNRVVTMSETLGRLVSCGFEVVDTYESGYLTWFAARKVDAPRFDMNPTYGAIVGLNRVGKDGKMIKVYKLRTMHPYSEYIQQYMYDANKLKKGGKIEGDNRITSWGRVLRKLWLDELPMLYNMLCGHVKLVGVRPLSRHYFSLYPTEMQQMRIKYKPGLIPPFYADMPATLEEIIASERRYLQQYDKAPIRTDIRYFFRSMYNILFKRARSC